jgi:hypothetical protein
MSAWRKLEMNHIGPSGCGCVLSASQIVSEYLFSNSVIEILKSLVQNACLISIMQQQETLKLCFSITL